MTPPPTPDYEPSGLDFLVEEFFSQISARCRSAQDAGGQELLRRAEPLFWSGAHHPDGRHHRAGVRRPAQPLVAGQTSLCRVSPPLTPPDELELFIFILSSSQRYSYRYVCVNFTVNWIRRA